MGDVGFSCELLEGGKSAFKQAKAKHLRNI